MRNVQARYGRSVASRWLLVALTGGLLCVQQLQAQTPAQRTPTRQRTVPKPFTPSGADQPNFKGIWEPINYPDDLILTSVFFVTDQIGWIVGHAGLGNGGFILYTEDAGEHWAMQLGDSKSTDPEISSLRFLDARHGWAIQNNKILRTSDGANWEDVGTLPPNINFNSGGYSFTFTSPTHGAILGGNPWLQSIFVTEDGGRTWKQVFTCATRIEVNGLMVNTGCYLVALQFATPSVGYAVGGSLMANSPYFFTVAKTEDGGESWRVVYTSDTTIGHAESVFFQDESNGVTKNADGKFYRTTDGGLTWKGAMGDANWEELPFFFPDSQVGWSAGARRVSFTTDGGAHWSSRNLGFPADVLGFSFPSRHRGYAVGWHGMIYRYSVVPANYQASAHSIDAPAMPGYDSPLNGEVANLKSAVNDLATQMQTNLGITAPGIASGDTGTVAQTPAGGSQQRAQAPGQDTGQGRLQQSTATSPAANTGQGGFQQDTSTPGTGSPAGQSGGFQQSPPSVGAPSQDMPQGFQPTTGVGIVASCCGLTLQKLEMAANTFANDLPRFSGKFRNLNLIVAGLQFINDLLQRTNALKLAINNLRQAHDKQSAATALNALSGQVNGIPNNVNGGFEQDTGSAFPQSGQNPLSLNAPSQTVAQLVGNQASSTQQSTQQSTNHVTNPVEQVDKAVQKAKEKLKKKLPW